MSDDFPALAARAVMRAVDNPDPETGLVDMVPAWRLAGLVTWAEHCPVCGRFARKVAGDSAAGNYWYRTDCAQCGVHTQVGIR